MSVAGKLTLKELQDRVGQGQITQVLAVFPDLYGRLMGKRIMADYFLEEVVESGIHACDYLLTVDMEMNPVPGYAFSSWDQGYGDFRALPDWNTLRLASWLERTAIVLCNLVQEEEDVPVQVAPRPILQRQLARADRLGYRVMGGSELEFYLFHEPYGQAREKDYQNLARPAWYIEDYHILQGTKEDELIGTIRHHLQQSGIPVEFSKGEWGSGQQEINLRYAELLEMADRHTLYKHLAKEVAWQQGKAVTFMAKWHPEEAGSSCHIHISLWRQSDGRSLFAPEQENGTPIPGTPVAYTPKFRHFVGGLLTHARAITLFLAPNVNSYKRFQPGTFAPTAITWSYDNRTAAFRVVGHGPSLRVECRIPGADVNPYLAYAALLAAGLDGIEKQRDPGELFSGDAYHDPDLPHLPTTLHEAIALAEQSVFLRQALGEAVMEHYLHFARMEQSTFDRAVTDWEKVRYFERI